MDLTGIGAASELGGKVVDFLGKIADRIWPDPQKKAEFMLEVQKVNQTGELAQLAADTELMKGQLAINQEEAKSTNIFISGWRPFTGWTCCAGLIYATVLNPIAQFVAKVMFSYQGTFPAIETGILVSLLTGLLGLGGMRTYEKRTGTEGNR